MVKLISFITFFIIIYSLSAQQSKQQSIDIIPKPSFIQTITKNRVFHVLSDSPFLALCVSRNTDAAFAPTFHLL